jgi:hypothetical protein
MERNTVNLCSPAQALKLRICLEVWGCRLCAEKPGRGSSWFFGMTRFAGAPEGSQRRQTRRSVGDGVRKRY